MIKKIFFLIIFFIVNLNSISLAENKFKIIATVNKFPITKLDLEKELAIIKILNNSIITKKEMNIALNNLIEEKIKTIEIEKEKLKIDDEKINNLYNNFVKNINSNNSNIDKKISNLIKEKIKIDMLWNELVAQKYAWKISVNINEINKIILQNREKFPNSKKTKEQLIIEEKNKKLAVYSNFYLAQLKNKTLIKYF